MTMSRGASISAASLIPDHDDSVENEKDFAPPLKKLKGEAEEAFKLWRKLFQVKKYADQYEKDLRFKYFKDTLNRKVDDYILTYGENFAELADRSEDEFRAITYPCLGFCSVSLEDLKRWEEETAVHPISPLAPPSNKLEVENEKEIARPSNKLKGEEDTSSVPMSRDSDIDAEEAFKLWRKFFKVKEYTDKSEKDLRFKYFKDSLNRKVDDYILTYGEHFAELADRSEDEFRASTYPCLGYCSVSLEDLKGWEELISLYPS